jgi:hypothetical protein
MNGTDLNGKSERMVSVVRFHPFKSLISGEYCPAER